MSERPGVISVLVVDDDLDVGEVLAAQLVQAGFQAKHVLSAQVALAELELRPFDVVLTDLRMPGTDGMELLQIITERFPDVSVVMLTAHGSVPLAVAAMRNGAADFMLKPWDKDELVYTVRKAATRTPDGSRQEPAQGSAMREIDDILQRAAQGTATVLVRGESGTGKELAARAVHERGPRKDKPFVRVHCAALPDALLESELFGYEKGAFTGAACRKPGRVELAEGGTLFLDEIGDISASTQVKLLRVLQEREYERLGGTQTLKADVRFIAATHQDLEAMVQARTFREDLFYRLNVVPVWIPPLRERTPEIEGLARQFAVELGQKNGRGPLGVEDGAIALLRAHAWPGNVRQLQNFIERLVVLGTGPTLTAAEVQKELARSGSQSPGKAPVADAAITLESRVRDAEIDALKDALARAGGNRNLAAKVLGVSRRTLFNKLSAYGVS
jgi:two-component system, NtrC family, response regulator AtoC